MDGSAARLKKGLHYKSVTPLYATKRPAGSLL